jgi:hypothetical protein
MKSFLKNLSLISLGALISASILIILPQQIRAVTANLNPQAIVPLINENELFTQLPRSSQKIKHAIPFALPDLSIHTFMNYKSAPLQMDINGDGLIDIVYSYSPHILISTQYVLLNNGNGFENGYLCKKSPDVLGFPSYQGDCADPNHISP